MRIKLQNYTYLKSISGQELHKDWPKYSNLFFLDSVSTGDSVPYPVVEYLYWIERNPEADFDIFEHNTEEITIQ